MGSLKALQEWCRLQCEDYHDVAIKDMSSSFRDGLAFCALIHKHRPDLIDFSSLSKENVYQNNRLTQLGIPALLDPEDMVSMRVPDRLSIITYVSQYYNFFNNKSQANPPCMKRPSPVGPIGELAQKKPALFQTTKQLRLRCTECHSTLLPGSYKLVNNSGSLVCTHHFARLGSKKPELSKKPVIVESARIGRSPVPHSASVSCKTENNEDLSSDEKTTKDTVVITPVIAIQEEKTSLSDNEANAQPAVPPNPFDESDEEEDEEDVVKEEQTDTLAINGELPPAAPVSESECVSRPVPAPRRVSDPAAPSTRPEYDFLTRPAPHQQVNRRSLLFHRNLEKDHGLQEVCLVVPKIQRPPMACPASNQVLSPSQPSSCSASPALSTESLSSGSEQRSAGGASSDQEQTITKSTSEPSIASPDNTVSSSNDPRPPSAPVRLTSLHTPAQRQPLLRQPQFKRPICKENPFNRKASPASAKSKGKPPKGPRPARPPAPGHGFPLIKRKVQSDQFIPTEDIYGEMNQLEKQLDELEQRGVELEKKLRDNPNDEEHLLVDWFTLIHEKHLLVRREAELVYTAKQQNLEERQADVEYELRCLLNKPEKDWTEEDKSREQELMSELVTIIEQRNQIVNTMDQDRQREEEEDKLMEAMLKKKDFSKEPDCDQHKKKAAKFKPIKVFKRLSHKGEHGKSPSPHKDKS
ncbi:hypothetical protein WMY93_013767 [Mugilogobius chulae]|uniref:MICAL-like protein 1 n=1 Tax=Mugilogobius chulae TaxID=88201 RepID=A0AAW0P787_9GOBI